MYNNNVRKASPPKETALSYFQKQQVALNNILAINQQCPDKAM